MGSEEGIEFKLPISKSRSKIRSFWKLIVDHFVRSIGFCNENVLLVFAMKFAMKMLVIFRHTTNATAAATTTISAATSPNEW